MIDRKATIYNYIQKYGPVTDDDIAGDLGDWSMETVRRDLRKLHWENLIIESEKSGRQAWIVKP